MHLIHLPRQRQRGWEECFVQAPKDDRVQLEGRKHCGDEGGHEGGGEDEVKVEMKVGTSVNALSALTGWVRMGKRVAALKFHPWSGN